MVYPLLVEVKHLFVQKLPSDLSIREKRERVHALDMACNELLEMDVEQFNFRCYRIQSGVMYK
jgi:hypothetical protein